MKSSHRNLFEAIVCSAGVLSAAGCGIGKNPAATGVAPVATQIPEGSYRPTATFQEIMDSIVDPASDYIWGSVSTMADASGIHEKRPQNDEQWHEVRRRAIVLAESANLIAVPGRRVVAGNRSADGAEELPVKQIQQRLDDHRAELVGFADALRQVSVKIAAAADKQDPAAIEELGGTLDEVCESCHRVFWYPGPARSPAN